MLRRQLLAEAFGGFCLVFAGTGAIIVDGLTEGGVSHVGIALTFGLVVFAMIESLGELSGCHINPAVTVGFWAAGLFPGRRVVPYIVAQCVGALLASGTLRALFPESPTLGQTLPSGTALQSFVLEAILTFILMMVILSVACGAKETGLLAGLTIGAVIALEATFAGPISGASMNPARSLGPAVIAGQFQSLWVYLTAPVIGAVAAVPLFFVMQATKGQLPDGKAAEAADPQPPASMEPPAAKPG